MKRTLLLSALFFLLCFWSGNSQSYNQDFEGEVGVIPTGWTTFKLLNGVVSTSPMVPGWTTSDLPANSCDGTSAYVTSFPQTVGNVSESWLVSEAITVPANMPYNLYFDSRKAFNDNTFPTRYKVKISTTVNNDPAAFTTQLIDYNGSQLTPWGYDVCYPHGTVTPIQVGPFAAATQIYIAFVKVDTQDVAGNRNDRWILDNVRLLEKCEAPTNGNAVVQSETATLTWAGPANTNYEVAIIQGNNMTNDGIVDYTATTNSVEVSGLTAATTYTYYVRRVCTDNTSDWAGPFTFTTGNCGAATQCVYTFIATDSYGDGWNGAQMTVSQNGVVVQTITLTTGSTATFQVPLCGGMPFELRWTTAGSFPGEVGIRVLDGFGDQIYQMTNSSSNTTGLKYTATVNCTPPTCPKPTNVVATTNITDNSIEIAWTEMGGATQWEIIAVPVGGAAPADGATVPGSQIATTNPYVYTGLSASTKYTFYVRALCDENDISDWRASATTFETQPNFCAGSHFYDNGGPTGNYSGNTTAANGTTVICNPNPNGALLVTFHAFDTEAIWDVLRVYDGSDSSAPLIGTFSGNAIPASFASTGPCLTFVFTSDGSLNKAGWDISLQCVSLTCPAPTNVQAQTTQGSSSVVLSWLPGGAETQWEVIIQEEGTGYPATGVTGQIVNTTTMAFMAQDNVMYEYYVRAVCSDDDQSYWVGPIRFNIFRPPGCAEIEVVGVDVDIIDNRIVVCPDEDTSVELQADFFGVATTTEYGVESIPYNPPFPFTGGIEMDVTIDDAWTSPMNLPFNFCFFGQSYNKVQVGSNGVVTFNATYPANQVATCPYAFTNTIPNTGFPIKNAIFGVYQDIDPTVPGANPSINYQVLGTYPCRALVVNYSDVKLFYEGNACGQNYPGQTYQIVLYEISNIIEVYVKRRDGCTSFNSGSGLIGIINNAGNQAYTPPGRNTGAWSTQNEAWRFYPTGTPNVDFSWSKDGEFVTHQNNVTVTLSPEELSQLQSEGSLTFIMTAKAVYDTCTVGENYELEKDVEVTFIYNFPDTDPDDLYACSADGNVEFDLTENEDVVLAGVANPQIFEFTYFNSEEDAEDGSPLLAIADPEHYQGANEEVIWIRISDLTNQCFDVKSFTLYHGELTQSVADFTYAKNIFCINETNPMPIYGAETPQGGTFSANSADIAIDPVTGMIDLANSLVGEYTITYEVADRGCVEGSTATFDVTIVNDNSVIGFTYEFNRYCKNADSGLINPILDNDFTTGGVFTAEAGLAIDAATGQINIAGSQAGTYQVLYTLTGACGEYSSSFEITIVNGETPVVEFSYNASQYCINGANPVINLPAGFTTGGQYSTTSGLILDQNTGAITLAGSALGTYVIEYVVAATECSPEARHSVTIILDEQIDPITQFNYPSSNYCVSEGIVTPVLDPMFFNGGTFSAPAGLDIDPTTGDINTQNSQPGTYTVTYTVAQDAATCNIGGFTQATVIINGGFAVHLDEECMGTAYWLHATPVDGSFNPSTAQYIWTIDGVQLADNTASINVSDLGIDPGANGVVAHVRVIDGCDGEANFTITSTLCMIPRGITPNNDGLNDYFDLTGMGVRTLKIFNRYGREVYSKSNYAKEWNGQDNSGNELPTGTYFYSIDRSNGQTVTGWVYINRIN